MTAPLVSVADVLGLVPQGTASKLFDRDGTSVPDEAYVGTLAAAVSQRVRLALGAELPGTDAQGRTTDPALRDAIVALIAWEAMLLNPLFPADAQKVPFDKARQAAEDYLAALRAEAARAASAARTGGTVGAGATPWIDAANRTKPSLF